jgi:hypothetical protein
VTGAEGEEGATAASAMNSVTMMPRTLEKQPLVCSPRIARLLAMSRISTSRDAEDAGGRGGE